SLHEQVGLEATSLTAVQTCALPIFEGGHVIMFTAGKNTLTEVIVTNYPAPTDRGLLQSIPCRGEKYHEMTSGGNIRYMISTQEEDRKGGVEGERSVYQYGALRRWSR